MHCQVIAHMAPRLRQNVDIARRHSHSREQMTDAGSAVGPTAAVDVPLVEDDGPDTQDRFRWQHHCTAADALRMLVDDHVLRVVCEVHADYVVERSSGSELVSCKHREQHRGPWKLTDICKSGGIAKLFSRWIDTGAELCRLMTNASLAPGANESADVFAACGPTAEVDKTELSQRAVALAQGLLAAARADAGKPSRMPGIPNSPKPARGKQADCPDDFLALVVQFMSVLTIRPELPSRDLIETHHAEELARTTLEKCGLPTHDVRSVYMRLVESIGTKNLQMGLTGEYSDWLTNPKKGLQKGSQRALVQARTINPEQVRALMTSRPVDAPLRRHATTGQERLRAKLRAGGSDPNSINVACLLQEAWHAEWASFSTGLPGDTERRDNLETRIILAAGRAATRAKRSSDKWADEIWESVEKDLEDGMLDAHGADEFTVLHLLGLMFDLSARCQVWFSPEFDVDSVVQGIGISP
jgi:hypothetical protein